MATSKCPVCGSPAKQAPTTGDFENFECSRCGKFEITGTALAMLPHRLEGGDVKTVARLSHSIRHLRVGTEDVAKVNSVNLDELASAPLPNVQRQMTHLLKWMAQQLQDDELGEVNLEDQKALTAIIGTIDEDRVDELINRTARDGLIENEVLDSYRISNLGWDWLRPPASREEPVIQPATQTPTSPTPETDTPAKKVKAHCNACGGMRNAEVRASFTDFGNDGLIEWSTKFDTLQCSGCDGLSVRKEHWFSEWDTVDEDERGRPIIIPGVETTHYPAKTVRKQPAWLGSLSDQTLLTVINELYIALTNELSVVSSIAARTLLDRAGFLLVGDQPNFAKLLAEMETQRFISGQEKDILAVVADAGSASAHRGYAPTAEQLGHIVDAIEMLLQRSFTMKRASDELRNSTPQRPKKSKP
ncbi:hypothetical protein [Asticcacaulis sp. W401b]|uniref:hypothetical protein n=1 Tax=Asticcacaulis sp. W401b TaxID=3388666 RepID=UPI0039707468